MNSIVRDVDGSAIAAEVRMQRQVHKGSILLLEGKNDVLRFQKFQDDIECFAVDCFGKRNVEFAIDQLTGMHFKGVLGIIDNDFDCLLNRARAKKNIVYSEHHDFDVDWFFTDALARYVAEVCDKSKMKSFAELEKFRDCVLQMAKPLSCLRYINEEESLRISLKDLDHSTFCNGYKIDVPALIADVIRINAPRDVGGDSLQIKIERSISVDRDLKHLTNGHDISAIFGIMLQGRIAQRHSALCRSSEIERSMRLAFDVFDFRASKTFAAIKSWEVANHPYLILDGRLN